MFAYKSCRLLKTSSTRTKSNGHSISAMVELVSLTKDHKSPSSEGLLERVLLLYLPHLLSGVSDFKETFFRFKLALSTCVFLVNH